MWLIHRVRDAVPGQVSAHFYGAGVLPVARCGYRDPMAELGRRLGHPEWLSAYRDATDRDRKCKRCGRVSRT